MEQGIEDGPGLFTVSGENIPLADVVGPLAPGEGRLVKGDIADQVEGIEIPANLLGQGLEKEAFLFQFFNDYSLTLDAMPTSEELIETGEALAERLFGIVAEALGDEPAVFIEVFDALGLAPGDQAAADNNPSFREADLFPDLRQPILTCPLNGRGYKLGADVALRESFLHFQENYRNSDNHAFSSSR